MIPSAYLYAANNVTLIYTFSTIMAPIEGFPNTDNPKNVTYGNIRSAGELSVSGGTASDEIVIRGRLKYSNYDNLISAFNTLQSTIVANTPYILKVDLTPSTTQSYNVKRKGKIEIENTDNLTTFIYFAIRFTIKAF
jgi:hypothetical protein